MKNLIKISLVVAAIFAAPGVKANDEVVSLKVKAENNKSIRFYIDEAKDIELAINDAVDNRLIYQESIHASGASTKTYDLNELPDGEYTLNVTTGSQLAQYQINIVNNKAEVSEPKITEVFKPILEKDSAMVTLSLDNADKSPIEVEIVNEFNEQLYKETFTNRAKLTKKFNVGSTPSKELTFIVTTNKQQFTKTIESR
ncbi:hypothetical protein [Pedobacter sp. Leaf170]|uniref:hypothetical protein n=1 Tax=Pedobacter sp. Leaf170 TaxID=2876558 RepID=UPI001E406B31|nr:hypothetical protein [Pedobacter sp. Leaf170]